MIKYAEFCAGVGGFRLGIQATTHDSECVYKNEIDSKCEDTYYKNFNEKFDSKDIFEINVEDIPDIDAVCPPVISAIYDEIVKTIEFSA